MHEDRMKHGAFGWFELMTTDVESAKVYYRDLFGWEYETVPLPGFSYTVIKVGSESVGGIMDMSAECEGMPPSWDIYVTVDDVDAVAANVMSLGGKILKPAFDIPDVGRFCVIQDPQGAVICAITYIKK